MDTINVSAIERELSTLWKQAGEEGDSGVIRACLVNFLVYVPDPGQAGAADEIITKISAEHPARAILIIADRDSQESALSAEVSSRCTLPGGMSKQVCCEQITIRGSGELTGEIPSATVSLLLSDLPVCLWWRAVPQLSDRVFKRLVDAADRVIIDSAEFADQYRDLKELATLLREKPRWTQFSDLNWSRLTTWRALVAGFYDVPEYRSILDQMNRVTIEYVPLAADSEAVPARAMLLAGWIASRLGWSVSPDGATRSDGATVFDMTSGDRKVAVEFRPAGPQETRPGIVSVTIESAADPDASFAVKRSPDGNRILTEVNHGGKKIQRVLGYESWDEIDLIGRELEIMGRDRVYEQAIMSAGELVSLIH
jgi:glucose-6-phosphate dehydrogenase assembly protein OpcA